MSATRAQVKAAIMAIIEGMSFTTPIMGASSWVTTSDRLKLWGEVDAAAKPYACLLTHSEQDDYVGLGLSRRRLNMQVWCYAVSPVGDPTATPGSDILDTMMDAFSAAFGQAAVDNFSTNENTLDGLVYWCRLQGRVFKDPGDLDGDILLIVPLVIEMP